MIEYFIVEDEKLSRSNEILESDCWINVTRPTIDDCAWLVNELGVHSEYVNAATDDEERSHVDDDPREGQTLIIVDYPMRESAAETLDESMPQYDTHPLSILLLPRKGVFVTISLYDNPLIDALVKSYTRGNAELRQQRLLLDILYDVSQKYLYCLRDIDRQFKRNERELREYMRNAELIKMLGLERSLIYFSTSLKALQAVLIKLDNGKIIKFTGNDRDDIDDIKIEVSQATEMCDIATKLLNGSMDAFGSVISNNMNITMRRLTTITLTLSVPTMVFSFYGMNVGMLPFAESFLFPILLSVTCCIIVAVLFTQSKLYK